MRLTEAVRSLTDAGWTVRIASKRVTLAAEIARRYAWVPDEIVELVESLQVAASGDDKAWLLTARDFNGVSASAYRWDEWERQSLDAAGDDTDGRARITQFWNDHFPIAASVRSGYAYLAVARGSLGIVEGDEPEYEEPRSFAASLPEGLRRLVSRDSSRW
jgi:hypothetical protein